MSFVLMSCSTTCFYLSRSAPLALPLDMMGYVGFTGKKNSGTRWAAISCSQCCLENRCDSPPYPPPPSPILFILLLSCTIFSARPLQELCWARGCVPSYLKVGAEDEGHLPLSCHCGLAYLHASFNLWHGYAYYTQFFF